MQKRREILLATGYKSFEQRSFVLLLLTYCPQISLISRYASGSTTAVSSIGSRMVRGGGGQET